MDKPIWIGGYGAWLSKQKCPDCNIILSIRGDSAGGSNHYWQLICEECGKKYEWGTYDLDLLMGPN